MAVVACACGGRREMGSVVQLAGLAGREELGRAELAALEHVAPDMALFSVSQEGVTLLQVKSRPHRVTFYKL